MPDVLTQSFAKSVSSNNLNYVLLKRKNGKDIPAMHPRDQFMIFAMIDRFLGGDGFWLKNFNNLSEDSPASTGGGMNRHLHSVEHMVDREYYEVRQECSFCFFAVLSPDIGCEIQA
jgi:hypothetical protein